MQIVFVMFTVSILSIIFQFSLSFNPTNCGLSDVLMHESIRSETNTLKPLPDKLLVGYTTNKCQNLNDMSKVTRAVQEGLNVVIWAFHELAPEKEKLRVKGGPNLDNFERYKQKLVDMGYTDVVHVVSFGGWNGPHLPSGYTAKELFDRWKEWNVSTNSGDRLFDGIDWDLEGEDNVQGSKNLFTQECLEQMGEFTELAKRDGYIVSMAPAESYVDITSSKFSRNVNLTYPEHEDFTYHGWNVYAYILAKWGEHIDFIQVQFYESYSHAAYQISQRGVTPSDFLVRYVDRLMSKGEGYQVNFEEDSSIQLKNQFVSVPLKKLVFGFANGWADFTQGGTKTVFFPLTEVKSAYERLVPVERTPRGFMFWVIEEEGNGGIYLASGLNGVLRVRSSDFSSSSSYSF